MLAGLWITFGGLAGLAAAGGIPVEVRNVTRVTLGWFPNGY